MFYWWYINAFILLWWYYERHNDLNDYLGSDFVWINLMKWLSNSFFNTRFHISDSYLWHLFYIENILDIWFIKVCKPIDKLFLHFFLNDVFDTAPDIIGFDEWFIIWCLNSIILFIPLINLILKDYFFLHQVLITSFYFSQCCLFVIHIWIQTNLGADWQYKTIINSDVFISYTKGIYFMCGVMHLVSIYLTCIWGWIEKYD